MPSEAVRKFLEAKEAAQEREHVSAVRAWLRTVDESYSRTSTVFRWSPSPGWTAEVTAEYDPDPCLETIEELAASFGLTFRGTYRHHYPALDAGSCGLVDRDGNPAVVIDAGNDGWHLLTYELRPDREIWTATDDVARGVRELPRGERRRAQIRAGADLLSNVADIYDRNRRVYSEDCYYCTYKITAPNGEIVEEESCGGMAGYGGASEAAYAHVKDYCSDPDNVIRDYNAPAAVRERAEAEERAALRAYEQAAAKLRAVT